MGNVPFRVCVFVFVNDELLEVGQLMIGVVFGLLDDVFGVLHGEEVLAGESVLLLRGVFFVLKGFYNFLLPKDELLLFLSKAEFVWLVFDLV